MFTNTTDALNHKPKESVLRLFPRYHLFKI